MKIEIWKIEKVINLMVTKTSDIDSAMFYEHLFDTINKTFNHPICAIVTIDNNTDTYIFDYCQSLNEAEKIMKLKAFW